MTPKRRCIAIATMCFSFTTLLVAEESIPPLPRIGSPSVRSNRIAALPEQHSPCTIDVHAEWLKPLKKAPNDGVRYKIPHPINCDGAVISSVLATGGGSVTTLQFTIALRAGQDREGIVTFAILDSEKQLVATGEASDNLDENADSYLFGTLTLKNKDFERVFAKGEQPTLRITLRVED